MKLCAWEADSSLRARLLIRLNADIFKTERVCDLLIPQLLVAALLQGCGGGVYAGMHTHRRNQHGRCLSGPGPLSAWRGGFGRPASPPPSASASLHLPCSYTPPLPLWVPPLQAWEGVACGRGSFGTRVNEPAEAAPGPVAAGEGCVL